MASHEELQSMIDRLESLEDEVQASLRELEGVKRELFVLGIELDDLRAMDPGNSSRPQHIPGFRDVPPADL